VTAGHDCTVVADPNWVDGGRMFAIAGGSSCLGFGCAQTTGHLYNHIWYM